MRLTHVAFLLATSGMLHAASDAPKRLDDSADMLTDIMSAPDKGIPQDLLQKAHCVVLVPGPEEGRIHCGRQVWQRIHAVPQAQRRGLVCSSGHSRGRRERRISDWRLGNRCCHAGEQRIGGEETAGEQIHAGRGCIRRRGSCGAHSSAETDAQLHAEILTWSRSRGVFAGISLQGATLRPDDDWNKELYASR